MFANIDEARKFIEKNGIAMVDLKFVDVPGRWHHITIPAENCDERILDDGIPFDSSSIPGFDGVSSGDMALIADISTAFVDPFTELPTLCFISNICAADTKANIPGDPRGVAIRASEYLRRKLAAESVWLPEIEFYLFDSAEYRTDAGFSYFDFTCAETDSSSNGFALSPRGGYHSLPPMDSANDVRAEMVTVIREMGIPVKYHHHEVGPNGQNEIEIIPTTLLKAADAVMMMKYAIRMVAAEYGFVATFLPKPLYNEPGSGMHFHQFLRKGGTSLFWDENSEHAHFSDMGKSYISGLLDHAPSLIGLTNPSTNSYKRLVQGFEAPTRRFYGVANRSAAIRIPKYDDNHKMKRCEFRPPDATCNPYLAIAAQLMAGLDGIERKLNPVKLHFGPFDDNIEKWSERNRKRIMEIPVSIFDSLKALDSDRDYLTSGGVFDNGLISRHIDLAKGKAIDISRHPTAREMELYFDI